MIYKSYQIEDNISVLKGDMSIFYGENLGLKIDFKKKLKNCYKTASINLLSQDEVLKNSTDFYSSFVNQSLFSEQKIYFIDSVNDQILNLLEELEDKIDNNKIFMFADKLEKKSKLRSYFEKSKNFGIIPCYPDNEINLRKIINNRLKNYIGITAQHIQLLINYSNLDRVKLNNELDKIDTYFYKKKITETELLELLNLKENDDFTLIKDAALNGNNKQINQLLSSTFIQDDKIIYYINVINQRLNKLYEILSVNDKSVEQTIDNLKPPIFWKDKNNVLEQCKKWNCKKINIVLKEIFDFEVKFKSSTDLNKNILMKKTLIDICNFANA